MEKLTAHQSNPLFEHEIYYKVEQIDEKINITFKVYGQLSTNSKFSQEKLDNYGLWEFDVVEVFIQGGGDPNHYLELQVSPLNQKFALEILKPREETREVKALKSKVSGRVTEYGFRGEFLIFPSDIPGDTEYVKIGLFACVGPVDARCYFALNINNDTNPDYHRPDLFVDIGDICQES